MMKNRRNEEQRNATSAHELRGTKRDRGMVRGDRFAFCCVCIRVCVLVRLYHTHMNLCWWQRAAYHAIQQSRASSIRIHATSATTTPRTR